MTCVICKNGQTKPGKVTVTLQRGESIIVIKEVPAEVCNNCGEYYLSDSISSELLRRAERAIKNGTIIEILNYAA